MQLRHLNIWIIGLLITGCTNMCATSHKEMTAEEVVEAYLDAAFNIQNVDDIGILIKYTSGNLKQALESADAKTVELVFINKKYNLNRFSVIERRDRTPREVEVTYELAYNELNDESSKDALVLTENTLNLVKQKGAWFITDVIGGQTSIDFQVASEITPEKK